MLNVKVEINIKVAATDMMRYFARSLVHKKNLDLIRQVVLKLGDVFFQAG